jgi:hypothetical protein
MGGDGGPANLPGSDGAPVVTVADALVPEAIADAYSSTGGGAGTLSGGGAAGTEVGSTLVAPPDAEAAAGVFASGGTGGAGPDSGGGGGGGLFGGGGGGVGYYASGAGGGGGASLVPLGGTSVAENLGDGAIIVTWDAASGEGCTPVAVIEEISTPTFTG